MECIMPLTILSLLSLFSVHYLTVGADSLYGSGDAIVQLDVNNFDRTLTRSSTGWVMEFYATWCGHCQRFAPIYKDFAKSISGWSRVVRVGAIACSDNQNLPVCQRHNIRGYPTVKFFPPNMQSVGRGVRADNLRFTIDNVKAATLRFVESHVTRSHGSYPKLTRYENLDALLGHARNSGASHLFAIVEGDTSANSENLAKMVILDLSSSYPSVIVGRLHKSDILSYDILSHPLPSVMAVDPNSGRMRFVTRLTIQEDVTRTIESVSSETWIPGHFDTTQQSGTVNSTTAEPLGTDLHRRPATTPVPRIPQKLTPIDLESNVYYMLWNEVATRSKIRGSALTSLTTYIQVLTKYYPGGERLKSFLATVTSWLRRIDGEIDGVLYVNTIEGLQTDRAYVSKVLRWDACEGTKSHFRGYPCSLWMTFHALTVSAYEYHLDHPEEPFDPMEVLGAVRGYVRHYLGCRECAHHFHQMARHMEHEVRRPEDVILWLWNGHNRANNRLHGDPTEDPAYPKIQFPGPALCPNCRNHHGPVDKFNNNTDWNVTEVLNFLRHFYSKESIFQYFSSTSSVAPILPTVAPYMGHLNRGNPWEQTVSEMSDQSYVYTTPHKDQSVPGANSPTRMTRRGQPRLTTTPSPTNSSCFYQTTPWTACTTTCDPGVSTRLSNMNERCEMQLEMRVCQIRPCHFSAGNYRIRHARGHCRANIRSVSYAKLTFNGCTTMQGYRWRFCNQCPGYCCQPATDGTFWADVTCQYGSDVQRGMMRIAWIVNCYCRPGNC